MPRLLRILVAEWVRKISRYPWSSATVHVGTAEYDGLLDLARWRWYFGV